ncbi:TolB family protein [Flavicella sediminum]|uniref:TolB family protein n=1 Tax=Flavicella sediminum TaxID=2585141 RepID=UPI00111CB673|nr:hypothetical protein [Flavicella sediminum]
MKKSYLFFFAFILYTTGLVAQTLGNHSSKIEWKSIENKNVRVIFPKNTSEQAKRIADVIDYLNKNTGISVGNESKKIDVILQTQQVISNGFVTLAPFRSELFGTAPQNFSSLGSTDWLDLLTVHEYRHVLQYANSNVGFTKGFYFISGQIGWSASINLLIPDWYLEGDAVLSETLVSENGRGRNPSFFKEQRALLLNDHFYSYAKARNGSYKNIVPNAYPLGFVMTNYLRNNYGIETGKKILYDAAAATTILYPFSGAMKRHTGLTTTKMYKKAYTSLQEKFKTEATQLDYTPFTVVSKKNKVPSHYLFPQYLEDGTIVCLKTSYNDIPKIIQITDKKEKELTTTGITPDRFLSSKKNKLIWTTFQKDYRRGNTNYSNITIYDLNRNSKKTITKNGHYFSPNLSDDLSKIVAVKADSNLKTHLTILNAETGQVEATIQNPKNDFYSYPKWTAKDAEIIYLVRRKSKIAFFKYTIATKKTEQLSAWTAHTIENFTVSNNHIYFTASFSGIDNIYVLKDQIIKQISSVKVGAYTPNISPEGKIIYSDFTENGHQISELDLRDISPKNISIIAPKDQKRYAIKTTKIERPVLDSIPKNAYKINSFKGFFKGLQLHSWGFTQNNYLSNATALGLQFKNTLTDFSANVSVLFNENEKTTGYIAEATYSKYFIELTAKATKEDRTTLFETSERLSSIAFSENTISGGISIPLSKVKGNYSQSFQLESNYAQHLTNNYTNASISSFNFGAIESSVTFYNLRQTALQNLGPRFGQYFSISFKKGLTSEAVQQTAIQSILFFPGFSKNHSTKLVATWQKENLTNTYKYPNTFAFSRGYESLFNDEALKLSANYEFPIFYPDWGFWGLTYFKRIRGNLFFDFSKLDRKFSYERKSDSAILPTSVNRNSYGAELIFDNIFLNVLPVSIGLRQSILLNQDIYSTEKSNSALFLQLNF